MVKELFRKFSILEPYPEKYCSILVDEVHEKVALFEVNDQKILKILNEIEYTKLFNSIECDPFNSRDVEPLIKYKTEITENIILDNATLTILLSEVDVIINVIRKAGQLMVSKLMITLKFMYYLI